MSKAPSVAKEKDNHLQTPIYPFLRSISVTGGRKPTLEISLTATADGEHLNY